MFCRRIAVDEQNYWHGLIDDYIALGTDSRTKFEIEKEAKIGTWHGALIRKCQGSHCEKYEIERMSSLLQCIQCKMVSSSW